MNRKLAILFVLIGSCCLSAGTYQYVMNEQKEESIPIASDPVAIPLNGDKAQEIRNYLEAKYQENFQVEEKVQEYCLDYTANTLSTVNRCQPSSIKDSIYKVKNENGIEFVVKEVSYDTSKIQMDEETKKSQGIGFYDNYIHALKKEEVENELETLYTALFEVLSKVEIYDGLGLEDATSRNAYQFLTKTTLDKTATLDEFLTALSSNLEYEIKVHVKLDDTITRDNFQEIVAKFKNTSLLNTSNKKIKLNKVLLDFENDSRYIEYDRGFLNLKRGENIYDGSNEELYDKTIILGNGTSQTGISYDDFIALDKLSFTFK